MEDQVEAANKLDSTRVMSALAGGWEGNDGLVFVNNFCLLLVQALGIKRERMLADVFGLKTKRIDKTERIAALLLAQARMAGAAEGRARSFRVCVTYESAIAITNEEVQRDTGIFQKIYTDTTRNLFDDIH